VSLATLGLIPARSVSARAESADLAITGASATVSDISPSVVRTIWNVANNGPSTANGLVLVVTLPVGTTLSYAHIASLPLCTFDAAGRQVTCPLTNDVPAGGSTTAEVDLLNVANPAGSTLDIHGTLTSGTTDPDQSNNARSLSISVPGKPVPTTPGVESAELVLKAMPLTTPSFLPEGTVVLSWEMLNAGPAAAQSVTFVVEFPAGVTAATGNVSTRPCGSYDAVSRQLVCGWPGALESGPVLTVMVSFSTATLEPGSTVSVLARVASETTDPDPTDNQSAVTFTVGGPIPHTGTSSALLLWSATIVLSAGLAALLVARRRTW
jgi:LPXTG-motif cell wall-anchored protein